MEAASDPTTTPSSTKVETSVENQAIHNNEQQQQQQDQGERSARRPDNNNNNTNSSSSSLFRKLMDRQPLMAKSLTSAVIGALGAALGSYLALSANDPPNKSAAAARKSRSKSRGQRQVVDWLDILSFAIYGGFVGGPLGHYWDEWLKEHGPASRSKAMLLDQLIVQPPRLLLMYLVLDVTRAALRELPASWNRSCSNAVLSPAVALSWRVWPIASYSVLAMCNKKGKRRRRRQYTIAIHTCALLFVTELARRRVALRRGSA